MKSNRKSKNIEDIRSPKAAANQTAKAELREKGMARSGGSLTYDENDWVNDLERTADLPKVAAKFAKASMAKRPNDPKPKKMSKPKGPTPSQVTPGYWQTKSSKPSYSKLKAPLIK